ncbi:MAG: hypothetical protein MZV65_39410 [Chromatiales bacterium]|nr:hypothetical protein [Chromatiales bacterium]
MAQLFTNNAATTLAPALGGGRNDLGRGSPSSATFPVLGAGIFLVTLIGHDDNGNEATWEIVKVTGVATGNIWDIERAQEGTPALAWPQATRVELRLTAQSLLAPATYAERLAQIEGAMSESVRSVEYDDRGSLRALEGGRAVVSGLGLFVWDAGSDEPDDDESCFATANGRWLLEAVHWDVVDAWRAPDDESRDDRLDSAESPLAGAHSVRFGQSGRPHLLPLSPGRHSTRIYPAQTPKNRVIVTPPSELGGRIQRGLARVDPDADIVTIYLALTHPLPPNHLQRGDWRAWL